MNSKIVIIGEDIQKIREVRRLHQPEKNVKFRRLISRGGELPPERARRRRKFRQIPINALIKSAHGKNDPLVIAPVYRRFPNCFQY